MGMQITSAAKASAGKLFTWADIAMARFLLIDSIRSAATAPSGMENAKSRKAIAAKP